MVFKSLVQGGKTLGAAGVGYLAGSIAWSALTGLGAGILDMHGIHVPASLLLSAAPVAGVIGAGYLSRRVWNA